MVRATAAGQEAVRTVCCLMPSVMGWNCTAGNIEVSVKGKRRVKGRKCEVMGKFPSIGDMNIG